MIEREFLLEKGSDEIKEKGKTVWSETFSDSEKYIEYYFNSRYKNENFFLYRNIKGEIISSFHLNPYTIIIGEKRCKARYLIAAATHKEFRNLGLFRKLLLEVFNDIKNKNSIVFLHPAILNFYEQFGFAPTHYLKKLIINTQDLPKLNLNENEVSYSVLRLDELDRYKESSNEFSKNLGDSYIYKTKQNVKDILEEIHLEKGEMIYFENSKNKESGFFSYTVTSDGLLVKDILTSKNNKEKIEELPNSTVSYIPYIFYYFKERFPKIKITFNLPQVTSESRLHAIIEKKASIHGGNIPKYDLLEEEYLLSRIINLRKIGSQYFKYVLDKIKFKDKSTEEILFFITVNDKIILDNNITFIMDFKNKKLKIFKNNDKIEKKIKIKNIQGIIIEIDVLTTLIFNSLDLKKIDSKNKIKRVNSPEEEIILSLFTEAPGYIYQDV